MFWAPVPENSDMSAAAHWNEQAECCTMSVWDGGETGGGLYSVLSLSLTVCIVVLCSGDVEPVPTAWRTWSRPAGWWFRQNVQMVYGWAAAGLPLARHDAVTHSHILIHTILHRESCVCSGVVSAVKAANTCQGHCPVRRCAWPQPAKRSQSIPPHPPSFYPPPLSQPLLILFLGSPALKNSFSNAV